VLAICIDYVGMDGLHSNIIDANLLEGKQGVVGSLMFAVCLNEMGALKMRDILFPVPHFQFTQ